MSTLEIKKIYTLKRINKYFVILIELMKNSMYNVEIFEGNAKLQLNF